MESIKLTTMFSIGENEIKNGLEKFMPYFNDGTSLYYPGNQRFKDIFVQNEQSRLIWGFVGIFVDLTNFEIPNIFVQHIMNSVRVSLHKDYTIRYWISGIGYSLPAMIKLVKNKRNNYLILDDVSIVKI